MIMQVQMLDNVAHLQQVVRFEIYNSLTDTKITDLSQGYIYSSSLIGVAGSDINIRAITDPNDAVGSCVFILVGPSNYTRTETAAPYALFGDTAGNYNGWSSQVAYNTGSYQLSCTPYQGSGGAGVPGRALYVEFQMRN
jgi:hypothetical protein